MNNKILKKAGVAVSVSALIGVTIFLGINSKPSYMGGIQKVTFFSQSVVYRDKGFNELTYNGSNDYANYSKQMVGNQSTKAYSATGQSYVNEIANLYDMGAETIITSGFNSANAFSQKYNPSKPNETYDGIWTKGYKDKKVVLIDDNSLPPLNKNAVSINFKAEDAGFMAGIASAIYIGDLYQQNSEYKPSVAIWGGLAYSTVFCWLSGFEQAINWFNYQVLGYGLFDSDHPGQEKLAGTNKVDAWSGLSDHSKSLELATNSKTDNAFKGMKAITINNAGNLSKINYYKSPSALSKSVNLSDDLAEDSFYTGGFTSDPTDGIAGSNAAKKIKQVNKNHDSIVFPVAGGQTTETLANLNQNSKTMALGVDSDASVSTPNYAKNILGSATKNIRSAAKFGAWYADNNVKTKGVPKNTKKEYYDFAQKPSDDPKGWNVSEDKEGYGSQFFGISANDGVGFIESGKNLTNALKNIDLKKDDGTAYTFEELKQFGIQQQTSSTTNSPIIESFSHTFYQKPLDPKDLVNPKTKSTEIGLWIPDWTKYGLI